MKPNHEKILEILIEMKKRQNDRIEARIRMRNRTFRLLKFIKEFINNRTVILSRKSKRFCLNKFSRKIRRIRVNV